MAYKSTHNSRKISCTSSKVLFTTTTSRCQKGTLPICSTTLRSRILSLCPDHTTSFWNSIKPEFAANEAKNLDAGVWKTAWQGTTVIAAVRSVDGELKIGPRNNKEGRYFHHDQGRANGYTVMTSLDPLGCSYVWGACIECLVDRKPKHGAKSSKPFRSGGGKLTRRHDSNHPLCASWHSASKT